MAAITLDIGGNTRRLDRDIQKTVNKVYSINLKTKGDQPLGRITGKVNEFNKSLDASNARVIAFGASAGIIFGVQRAFSALVQSTIEVQKSLQDINVILNVSTQNLQKFGGELFNIARNTGQSFQEVAKAATEFSRQGLGVEETLKRTNEALILSRLSGLDAAKSVESLTAAVNSFASQAVTATEVVNKFATVDAAFAVSSADLADAIARVGSSAAQSGVSLNELIAIVTSAQQTTARGGAVIGNSFKTIFTRLQREKVVDLLGSLGISGTDSSGQVKSTIQLLTDLGKVYDTLGSQQQAYVAEQVGGVFQINILKAALADLGKEYSIYSSALNVAAGATDQAIRRNEELNKTYSAQINALQENARQLAAAGGERLLGPSIDRLVGGTNTLLKGFSESDGQGVGAILGKGILDGIGQFIAGPGIALVGGVLLKLFRDLAKFATGSVKELLGLNTAATQQRDLQQSINQILAKNPQLIELALKGEQGLNTAANSLLASLQKQTVELQKQAAVASQISKAFIAQAGVRVAGGVPVVPTPKTGRPGKAAGYIPNFAEEFQAKELGATSSVKAVRGVGKIGGKSFEANNQEFQLKNFAGTGETAVIPKYGNGIKEATKMIARGQSGSVLDKNDRNKARGFVPNFAKSRRDYQLTDGDSTINFSDKKQGRLESVDAVESWQKYGPQAKQEAEKIIYSKFPNTESLLKSSNGKAAYNRYSFRSSELQNTLIKKGLGVPDIRYSGQNYIASTLQTMQKNIGLWSDKNKDGFYNHPKAQQFIKQNNLAKKLALQQPGIDKNKKNFILGSATRFATGRFGGELLPETYKSGKQVNFQKLFASGFIPNFAQTKKAIDLGNLDTIPNKLGNKVVSLIYPGLSDGYSLKPATASYLKQEYTGKIPVAGINQKTLKSQLPDLDKNLGNLLVREANQFGQSLGGSNFLKSAEDLPNYGAAKGAVGVAFEGGVQTLLQQKIGRKQNAGIDFRSITPKLRSIFNNAPGMYDAKSSPDLTNEVFKKLLNETRPGATVQKSSGQAGKEYAKKRQEAVDQLRKEGITGSVAIRQALRDRFGIVGKAAGFIPNFAAPLVRAVDDKELRMMLSKFGKGFAFQNKSFDQSAMEYFDGSGTYMWDALSRPGEQISDRQAYKQNIGRAKNWSSARKQSSWLVRYNRSKLKDSELLPDMETGGASVYGLPLSKDQIVWPIKQSDGSGRIFEKDIPTFLSGQVNDAIKREKSAGIPSSQIYIAKEKALKSANPMGLGVFNKKDEPNKRARKMAMGSKGFASGFVPNFAIEDPDTQAADFGTAATAITAGLSTLAFAFAFNGDQYKESLKQLTQANLKRAKEELKQSRLEAKRLDQRGLSNFATTAREDASKRFRSAATPSLLTRGRAFGDANALGLSMAAPILGETIKNIAGQETKTQRGIGATGGALGQIGSFAATGALIAGPKGVAVGAAVGALLSVPDAINQFTSTLPDLTAAAKKASQDLTKFSDVSQRLLTTSDSLKNLITENAPPEKLKKVQDDFAKALSELTPAERARVDSAIKLNKLEEELAKITQEKIDKERSTVTAESLQAIEERKKFGVFAGGFDTSTKQGKEDAKVVGKAFSDLFTAGKTPEESLERFNKAASNGVPQLQNLIQSVGTFSKAQQLYSSGSVEQLRGILENIVPKVDDPNDQEAVAERAKKIQTLVAIADDDITGFINLTKLLIATINNDKKAIKEAEDAIKSHQEAVTKEEKSKKAATEATNKIIESLERNIRVAQMAADKNRALAQSNTQFARNTLFADAFSRPAETVGTIVGQGAPLAESFALREEIARIGFDQIQGIEDVKFNLVNDINESIKTAFSNAVAKTIEEAPKEGTAKQISETNKNILAPLTQQQEKAFNTVQNVLNKTLTAGTEINTEQLLKDINNSLIQANIDATTREKIGTQIRESADAGNISIEKLRNTAIQEFKTVAKEQSQRILISKIGQAQKFGGASVGGGIEEFINPKEPGQGVFDKIIQFTQGFDEFQYRTISDRQKGISGLPDGRFDYRQGTNDFKYQYGEAQRARQEMAPEYGRAALELIDGLQDFTGYTPDPDGKAIQAGTAGLKEFYDRQISELQKIAQDRSTPQIVKDEINSALKEVSKLGGTENIAKLQVAQRTGALTETAFQEITKKFQSPVLQALQEQAKSIKDPEDRARFEQEIQTLSSDILVSSDPTVKAINVTNNILKQILTKGFEIPYEAILSSPTSPPKTESKARGYIPAFNEESRAISRGVGGAKASDRPKFIPNLNGIPAFVNTGEQLVDNYMGSGETAVLTRDMQNAMVAAKGFIPNFAEKIKLENIEYKDSPIWDQATNQAKKISGQTSMVSLAERDIVVVKVNDVEIPFYRSTGKAGKKAVASGKFYPVLGIGEDGWINKGTQSQINDFYGSPELKKIANQLDTELAGVKGKPVGAKAIEKSVNRGLTKIGVFPVENGLANTPKQLQENLQRILEKIGGNNKIPNPAKLTEVAEFRKKFMSGRHMSMADYRAQSEAYSKLSPDSKGWLQWQGNMNLADKMGTDIDKMRGNKSGTYSKWFRTPDPEPIMGPIKPSELGGKGKNASKIVEDTFRSGFKRVTDTSTYIDDITRASQEEVSNLAIKDAEQAGGNIAGKAASSGSKKGLLGNLFPTVTDLAEKQSNIGSVKGIAKGVASATKTTGSLLSKTISKVGGSLSTQPRNYFNNIVDTAGGAMAKPKDVYSTIVESLKSGGRMADVKMEDLKKLAPDQLKELFDLKLLDPKKIDLSKIGKFGGNLIKGAGVGIITDLAGNYAKDTAMKAAGIDKNTYIGGVIDELSKSAIAAGSGTAGGGLIGTVIGLGTDTLGKLGTLGSGLIELARVSNQNAVSEGAKKKLDELARSEGFKDWNDREFGPNSRRGKRAAEAVKSRNKDQSVNDARLAFSTAYNKNWPLSRKDQEEFDKLFEEKPKKETNSDFIARIKETAPKQKPTSKVVRATKDDIDAFYGRGKYAPLGSKERTDYETQGKLSGLTSAYQAVRYGATKKTRELDYSGGTPVYKEKREINYPTKDSFSLFEDPIQRNIDKKKLTSQYIDPTIKTQRTGMINGRPAIEWQNEARIDAIDEAVKRGQITQENANKILEAELSKKTIENRRKERSKTSPKVTGGEIEKERQQSFKPKSAYPGGMSPETARSIVQELDANYNEAIKNQKNPQTAQAWAQTQERYRLLYARGQYEELDRFYQSLQKNSQKSIGQNPNKNQARTNFATGYIPNFAQDYISNLANLESGLSGEKARLTNIPGIGLAMINEDQAPGKFPYKDHPEGKMAAIKNSMKMQKSMGVMGKGYIPNFAATDQSFAQQEAAFNSNTSALTTLAGGIDSLNSTISNFQSNFANLNNASPAQTGAGLQQTNAQPNVQTTTNAPVNVVVNAQGSSDIAAAVGEAVQNAIPTIIDKVKVALGQKVPPKSSQS